MYQQQVNVINTVRMVLDAAAVIIAGFAAYHVLLYYVGGAWQVGAMDFVAMILGVMFVNNYLLGRFHMYDDRRPAAGWGMVYGIFKTLFVSFSLLCIAMGLFSDLHAARDFIIWYGGFSLLLMIVGRWLVSFYHRLILRKSFNVRHILIVGHDERSRQIAAKLDDQLTWGHDVVGFLALEASDAPEVLGSLADLADVLKTHSVDEVIFALNAGSGIKLDKQLSLCRTMGVTVKIVPSLWEPDQTYVNVEKCQGVPMLTYYKNSFNATGLLYKRVLDLIGGLVGCLILALIYPFIALAIKLESPGPVFFKQQRAGLNGRIFGLYKFRTMYRDAEARKKELMQQNKMQGLMFKMDDDPRITGVGRFLRKTSLDEFPQFINVLKGEISLVGTRPPTLDEVAEYDKHHHRRISAKPGITGLWQISGRNQITDFDEVVRLDCEYIDNWRFMDDIKILCKTVMVVFTGRGAV